MFGSLQSSQRWPLVPARTCFHPVCLPSLSDASYLSSNNLQCLQNTFRKSSPCKYFVWLDQDKQILNVDFGAQDPYAIPNAREHCNPRRVDTMSSGPHGPPPPPPPSARQPLVTQSGFTLERLPPPPKRTHAPCGHGGCLKPSAQDCSNQKRCKQCCRNVCVKLKITCKSRRHKSNLGTTAPLADVSSQVIASLDGQPQRTTFARNLPPALYDIVDHHNQIAMLADASDGATTQARREIDKIITVSTWSSVRIFPLLVRSYPCITSCSRRYPDNRTIKTDLSSSRPTHQGIPCFTRLMNRVLHPRYSTVTDIMSCTCLINMPGPPARAASKFKRMLSIIFAIPMSLSAAPSPNPSS